MSASNYAENVLLDHLISISTHIALCTADPTDAGTGADMSEVADAGAYARLAIAGLFGTAAAAGAIANDAAAVFTTATAAWGTVTHFALLDGGTHGADNMLISGALTTSRAVVNGDAVRFAIGELELTCA